MICLYGVGAIFLIICFLAIGEILWAGIKEVLPKDWYTRKLPWWAWVLMPFFVLTALMVCAWITP